MVKIILHQITENLTFNEVCGLFNQKHVEKTMKYYTTLNKYFYSLFRIYFEDIDYIVDVWRGNGAEERLRVE